MKLRMRPALLACCAVAAHVALATLGAAPVAAQHALVLSGGGARGIAHAGAIAALEELGYDLPIVVGTSMGAIIGALYAAGYSADEVRRITGEEQWIARFVADPVPVGMTRVPLRPLLDLGIGRPPQQDGLLVAHGVNLRLVELLFDAGARARNDFDRLPRRYRAVAADLSTGTQVVLGGYDLPRAVRASMAVPGAFAPVRWQDRVLVDGGVANNLPVSVARELTDLPVIAIDVLRPTDRLEERGPIDVGIRALRLLIHNARPDAAAEPEVLVLPPLASGFSESWFPRDAGNLLRRGYDAVMAQVPPPARGAPRAAVPGPHPAPARITRIEVHGGDRALDVLVERIGAPLVGAYDADRIIAATRGIYATNLFHAVWPRLDFPDGDDGPATLVVDVTPASPTGIALAARWDNDIGAGAWAQLRQRIAAGRPIELRGGGVIDELTRRASFDASLFSAAMPGLTLNAGMHGGEERVRLDGLHAVRRVGGWLGTELQGDWFVSVLARADHVRDDPGAAGSAARGWSAGPFVRVTQAPDPDRVVGVLPTLQAELRGGDVSYGRAHLAASVTARAGRLVAAPLVDVGWSSDAAPHDARFALTRELAPWLRTGTGLGAMRAATGLDVAGPFIMTGFARLRIRVVTTGDEWEQIRETSTWRAGAEIGAAWPSVIGMIEAGVAKGGGGDWRFNIGIGPALR